MKIRNYKKEDIPDIEKLGLLLHNNYKFLLYDFSNALVIIEEEKVIGFIVYSIIYERAEIIDIVVDPRRRNKGYAKALLNYLINDIISERCDNITLEVNKTNEIAIGLYKSIGFSVVATRKGYYEDSDGYLMKIDLRW